MNRTVCVLALAMVLCGLAATGQPAFAADGATASGCAMPGQDADSSALPPEQNLGGVRFITGGIGVEEVRAMKKARDEYPLALTFAEHYEDKDRFLADVKVEIRDADGQEVLCATSTGPYMFVDMPTGDYEVTATTGGGRQLVRKVHVEAGKHRNLALVWPASGTAE